MESGPRFQVIVRRLHQRNDQIIKVPLQTLAESVKIVRIFRNLERWPSGGVSDGTYVRL